MVQNRKLFALVPLYNKLFAIGGYNSAIGSLHSVEAYDMCSNKWEHISSMNEFRSSHGCAVHNNHIYVIGGDDECTVEYYDSFLDHWFMVCFILLYTICMNSNHIVGFNLFTFSSCR